MQKLYRWLSRHHSRKAYAKRQRAARLTAEAIRHEAQSSMWRIWAYR